MSRAAALVLEDGAVFVGEHFGAELDAEAEVVFNTSMTGYLEICTDPSYRGQMVVMCYPQIGNYGVALEHQESTGPWIAALIVRELADQPHHWQSSGDLDSYLRDRGVPGLQGVDTRAIVRRLRSRGTLRGVLRLAPSEGFDATVLQRLAAAAAAAADLSEKQLVAEVSGALPADIASAADADLKIAVVDFGIKHNIIGSLRRRQVHPVVLPWNSSAEDVLALRPSAVVLSNGPGDPATLADAVRMTGRLVESGIPLLGICLGHQLLGRALGATTSRLGYGHHGGNHPVKELATGKVTITTQNHEFQVDDSPTIAADGFVVSHRNLNDDSIEGLAHRERPIFSVQYHPEGCPGPQDNQLMFDRLVEAARKARP